MSRQQSRRRTYGRRQHELTERRTRGRADHWVLDTLGEELEPDTRGRAADDYARYGAGRDFAR